MELPASAKEEPVNRLNRLFITSLILLLFLIPVGVVSADVGPKPTMEFAFEYETDEPLTIVEGVLLQCEDPECLESYPLEELGPQHFSCTAESCSSMAYGYAGDNRLEITFSDGVTRQSNLFGKQNYNANYTVTVYEEDLLVRETGGSINPMGYFFGGAIVALCFGGLLLLALLVCLIVLITRGGQKQPVVETSRSWIIAIWVIGGLLFFGSLVAAFFSLISLALPLTILIEGILIFAYFTYRKQPWLLPTTLNLIGNLFTQVVLWYLLVNSASDGLSILILLISEAVIVLIEAAILYWPQRTQIKFTEALSISFVLNLVSFTIGLFLPV
jgi:hypothetical protein